jgi:hypothetical protein
MDYNKGVRRTKHPTEGEKNMERNTLANVNAYAARFADFWTKVWGEKVTAEVITPSRYITVVNLVGADGVCVFRSAWENKRNALQGILGAEAVLREIEQRFLVGELRKVS